MTEYLDSSKDNLLLNVIYIIYNSVSLNIKSKFHS